MTVRIEGLEHPPLPDIGRLVADLARTMPLFADTLRRARPLHPTNAVLQALGEACLRQQAPAAGAPQPSVVVAQLPGFATLVNSWHLDVLSGTVQLNYLLMALVLGRPDLRTHFHVRGRTNWDAALRWLILHGVRELELWPFFSGQFVNQLRAATVLMRGRRISPLMASVLAERPDVAALWRECAADRLAALFADWFIGNGVREYGLDWLLTGREVAQVIALAAQLPATPAAEGLLFPDGPSAPPAAALLARSPTLPHYRSFGADYPCAFLDIEAPANAIRAISAGEVRPGLRGGLELLSRYTAIALPHARGAAMLVLLDFAGSAVAPRGTWVRLRIRDEQDAPCCERTLPAAALAEGRLTLRLLSTGLRLRLEIAFARPGVPPAADDPSTQAVLRSLCVWQVAA